MRENATPSEGVQERFTAKAGLGEVSCDLGGFLQIVISLKMNALQSALQFSALRENVKIARTFPSR